MLLLWDECNLDKRKAEDDPVPPMFTAVSVFGWLIRREAWTISILPSSIREFIFLLFHLFWKFTTSVIVTLWEFENFYLLIPPAPDLSFIIQGFELSWRETFFALRAGFVFVFWGAELIFLPFTGYKRYYRFFRSSESTFKAFEAFWKVK